MNSLSKNFLRRGRRRIFGRVLIQLLFLPFICPSCVKNFSSGFILVFSLLIISLILSFISVFLLNVKEIYYAGASIENRYKFLYEALSLSKMVISEAVSIKGRGFIAYSVNLPYTRDIELGSRKYRINVEAEDGKLPIVFPYAKGKYMKTLLSMLGFSEEIAEVISDSLLDFQDSDNLRRIYGAEGEFYKEKGYRPPNKPLSSLQEILWIRGIDYDTYLRMKPFITVYSSKVNLLYAPKIVLLSLNIPENVVQTIIDNRKKAGFNPFEIYRIARKYVGDDVLLSIVTTPELFRVKVKEIKSGEEATFIIDMNGNLVDVLWY